MHNVAIVPKTENNVANVLRKTFLANSQTKKFNEFQSICFQKFLISITRHGQLITHAVLQQCIHNL